MDRAVISTLNLTMSKSPGGNCGDVMFKNFIF